MKKLLLLLGLCSLSLTQLSAEIMLDVFGGNLRDSNGNLLADGSLVFLVASTSDNIFSAPVANTQWSIGSTIGGSDDVVIQAFTINGSGTGAGTFLESLTVNYNSFSGLNAGDKLSLYWFPTLTSSSSTIFSGTSYGMYRTDDPFSSNSSIAWVAPADGGSYTLNFATTDFGMDIDPSLATANLTVIPEPATMTAIVGGIAAMVAFWRRRRPAATTAV